MDEAKQRQSSPLNLCRLGVGTIWVGRLWPPNSSTYTEPGWPEIEDFLSTSIQQLSSHGKLMLDTASGYGDSEEKLGEFFRKHPGLRSKVVVATKFGETYHKLTQKTEVCLDVPSLQRQFQHSLSCLGSVDLLYYHITSQLSTAQSLAILRDTQLTAKLCEMRRDRVGGLQLLGASISNPEVLKTALEEKLLDHVDVLQVPAPLAFEMSSVWKTLKQYVVVNSPVRKGDGKAPSDTFAQLFAMEGVHFVLTGTRTHLQDCIQYYANQALPAVPLVLAGV